MENKFTITDSHTITVINWETHELITIEKEEDDHDCCTVSLKDGSEECPSAVIGMEKEQAIMVAKSILKLYNITD